MSSHRSVSTVSELKAALDAGVKEITITDPDLARKVDIAKKVKKPVALAMLAGAGVVVANSWNPVGWVSGAAVAGLSAAGASVAIAAIGGLTLLGLAFLTMYNDYDAKIGAKGSVTNKPNDQDGPSQSAGGG
ncbi:hypothetical protein D0N87_26480, partial [Pseudomonas sp. ATCC 13867]